MYIGLDEGRLECYLYSLREAGFKFERCEIPTIGDFSLEVKNRLTEETDPKKRYELEERIFEIRNRTLRK